VAVGGEVPVRIYLPRCSSEPTARYPAAYFLHGKPYTEAQWLDLGIEALVGTGAASGELLPMIIVLARQPEPLFSGSDGGPGSYETEFLEGLVAWVDQTYPTDPDPARRAVVGLSRGGVWALEIGMVHPEAVGTVVALSPALAVNHARPPYDPLVLARTSEALPPNILLAAGDSDWARTKTEELARRLAERGAPFELRVVPGAHSDTTWEAVLPDVLEFLSSVLR
jgi:enterochelin esterase-like enzyme